MDGICSRSLAANLYGLCPGMPWGIKSMAECKTAATPVS